MALAPDPLAGTTLEALAAAVRRRGIRAEALVTAYLERIDRLDGALDAYDHVAADRALADARRIDAAIDRGEDPGPLAGLPVAVKDLFAVEGMPVTGGSRVDVAALVGPEGRFVRRLKTAGAVVLGKVRTVEFAFGASGVNLVRGTPWNPADPAVHRIPGGSSSGPAVAVAAGLAAFAIGSDTGGSVRIPAALCGVVGLKTSPGLWPTDGVLPLSPTFDTIGLLARGAADAAFALAALGGRPRPHPPAPAALRLARPTGYPADPDPAIAAAFDAAVGRLAAAGVAFGEVAMPEAAERERIFPLVLAAELMERFGADRFRAERDRLDPVVATRMERALSSDREDVLAAVRRHRELTEVMAGRLAGFDGWITPTALIPPPPLAAFEDPARGLALTMAITRNTQPVNLFGQCAVSLPLPGTPLPAGLQIAATAGRDDALAALAETVEAVIGRPVPADVSGFDRRP